MFHILCTSYPENVHSCSFGMELMMKANFVFFCLVRWKILGTVNMTAYAAWQRPTTARLTTFYGIMHYGKQTSHRQVHQAHTHTQTTYSHIPNKQLDDANKQRSGNALSTKDGPPEDSQTRVTETCKVLMMCFTNIFNNSVF
jgi:hypothetical protein